MKKSTASCPSGQAAPAQHMISSGHCINEAALDRPTPDEMSQVTLTEKAKNPDTGAAGSASGTDNEVGTSVYRIPRRIKPKEGLIPLDRNSRDGMEVLDVIKRSYLDQSYNSWWQPVSIEAVNNARLEATFREKKQEMRDADRGTQELAEGFAFTMLVKNSTNLLYKIVNEGMLTKKTPFNAFGDSAKGVYVCRHADVMLKFVESFKSTEIRIIIHKIIAGRRKAIAENSPDDLEPTPNFDSHVPTQEPSLTLTLDTQVMKSQIYLYEYNEEGLPVSHPRQCLPHAVVVFKGKSSCKIPSNAAQNDVNKTIQKTQPVVSTKIITSTVPKSQRKQMPVVTEPQTKDLWQSSTPAPAAQQTVTSLMATISQQSSGLPQTLTLQPVPQQSLTLRTVPHQHSGVKLSNSQTVVSQTMNPQQTLVPQVMRPQQIVDSQALRPQQSVVSQAMIPQQSVVSQAMRPQQSVVSQAMNPQQIVVSQAMNPQQIVVSQAMNPQQSVVSQALGLPQTVISQGMRPQQNVVSQALGLPQTVISQGMRPQQNVVSQALGLPQTVISQGMRPQQNVVSQALGLPQTVISQGMRPQQNVVSQSVSPQQTVVSQALSVQQTVVSPSLKPHQIMVSQLLTPKQTSNSPKDSPGCVVGLPNVVCSQPALVSPQTKQAVVSGQYITVQQSKGPQQAMVFSVAPSVASTVNTTIRKAYIPSLPGIRPLQQHSTQTHSSTAGIQQILQAPAVRGPSRLSTASIRPVTSSSIIPATSILQVLSPAKRIQQNQLTREPFRLSQHQQNQRTIILKPSPFREQHQQMEESNSSTTPAYFSGVSTAAPTPRPTVRRFLLPTPARNCATTNTNIPSLLSLSVSPPKGMRSILRSSEASGSRVHPGRDVTSLGEGGSTTLDSNPRVAVTPIMIAPIEDMPDDHPVVVKQEKPEGSRSRSHKSEYVDLTEDMVQPEPLVTESDMNQTNEFEPSVGQDLDQSSESTETYILPVQGISAPPSSHQGSQLTPEPTSPQPTSFQIPETETDSDATIAYEEPTDPLFASPTLPRFVLRNQKKGRRKEQTKTVPKSAAEDKRANGSSTRSGQKTRSIIREFIRTAPDGSVEFVVEEVFEPVSHPEESLSPESSAVTPVNSESKKAVSKAKKSTKGVSKLSKATKLPKSKKSRQPSPLETPEESSNEPASLTVSPQLQAEVPHPPVLHDENSNASSASSYSVGTASHQQAKPNAKSRNGRKKPAAATSKGSKKGSKKKNSRPRQPKPDRRKHGHIRPINIEQLRAQFQQQAAANKAPTLADTSMDTDPTEDDFHNFDVDLDMEEMSPVHGTTEGPVAPELVIAEPITTEHQSQSIKISEWETDPKYQPFIKLVDIKMICSISSEPEKPSVEHTKPTESKNDDEEFVPNDFTQPETGTGARKAQQYGMLQKHGVAKTLASSKAIAKKSKGKPRSPSQSSRSVKFTAKNTELVQSEVPKGSLSYKTVALEGSLSKLCESANRSASSEVDTSAPPSSHEQSKSVKPDSNKSSERISPKKQTDETTLPLILSSSSAEDGPVLHMPDTYEQNDQPFVDMTNVEKWFTAGSDANEPETDKLSDVVPNVDDRNTSVMTRSEEKTFEVCSAQSKLDEDEESEMPINNVLNNSFFEIPIVGNVTIPGIMDDNDKTEMDLLHPKIPGILEDEVHNDTTPKGKTETIGDSTPEEVQIHQHTIDDANLKNACQQEESSENKTGEAVQVTIAMDIDDQSSTEDNRGFNEYKACVLQEENEKLAVSKEPIPDRNNTSAQKDSCAVVSQSEEVTIKFEGNDLSDAKPLEIKSSVGSEENPVSVDEDDVKLLLALKARLKRAKTKKARDALLGTITLLESKPLQEAMETHEECVSESLHEKDTDNKDVKDEVKVQSKDGNDVIAANRNTQDATNLEDKSDHRDTSTDHEVKEVISDTFLKMAESKAEPHTDTGAIVATEASSTNTVVEDVPRELTHAERGMSKLQDKRWSILKQLVNLESTSTPGSPLSGDSLSSDLVSQDTNDKPAEKDKAMFQKGYDSSVNKWLENSSVVITSKSEMNPVEIGKESDTMSTSSSRNDESSSSTGSSLRIAEKKELSRCEGELSKRRRLGSRSRSREKGRSRSPIHRREHRRSRRERRSPSPQHIKRYDHFSYRRRHRRTPSPERYHSSSTEDKNRRNGRSSRYGHKRKRSRSPCSPRRKQMPGSCNTSAKDELRANDYYGRGQKVRRNDKGDSESKKACASSQGVEPSTRNKKPLYTDSEVMKTMLTPKPVTQKADANLFDCYQPDTMEKPRTGELSATTQRADPARWLEQLKAINENSPRVHKDPPKHSVITQLISSVADTLNFNINGAKHSNNNEPVVEGYVAEGRTREECCSAGSGASAEVQEEHREVNSSIDTAAKDPTSKTQQEPVATPDSVISDTNIQPSAEPSGPKKKIKITISTLLSRYKAEEKAKKTSISPPVDQPGSNPGSTSPGAKTSNDDLLDISHLIESNNTSMGEAGLPSLINISAQQLSSSPQSQPEAFFNVPTPRRISLDDKKLHIDTGNSKVAFQQNITDVKQPRTPGPEGSICSMQKKPSTPKSIPDCQTPTAENDDLKKLSQGHISPDENKPTIQHLERNLEKVKVKRKEIANRLQVLVERLDLVGQPAEVVSDLKQEHHLLDKFMQSLYIDEEIIKKEMDLVRKNIMAQNNKPMPASLLLPQEAESLWTASGIPLILMCKLGLSLFQTLQSLKNDLDATQDELIRTDVLDITKQRNLHMNLDFLNKERNKFFMSACTLTNMAKKQEELIDKLTWYRHAHVQLEKEYHSNTNPATCERMMYARERISDIERHLSKLDQYLKRENAMPADGKAIPVVASTSASGTTEEKKPELHSNVADQCRLVGKSEQHASKGTSNHHTNSSGHVMRGTGDQISQKVQLSEKVELPEEAAQPFSGLGSSENIPPWIMQRNQSKQCNETSRVRGSTHSAVRTLRQVHINPHLDTNAANEQCKGNVPAIQIDQNVNLLGSEECVMRHENEAGPSSALGHAKSEPSRTQVVESLDKPLGSIPPWCKRARQYGSFNSSVICRQQKVGDSYDPTLSVQISSGNSSNNMTQKEHVSGKAVFGKTENSISSESVTKQCGLKKDDGEPTFQRKRFDQTELKCQKDLKLHAKSGDQTSESLQKRLHESKIQSTDTPKENTNSAKINRQIWLRASSTEALSQANKMNSKSHKNVLQGTVVNVIQKQFSKNISKTPASSMKKEHSTKEKSVMPAQGKGAAGKNSSQNIKRKSQKAIITETSADHLEANNGDRKTPIKREQLKSKSNSQTALGTMEECAAGLTVKKTSNLRTISKNTNNEGISTLTQEGTPEHLVSSAAKTIQKPQAKLKRVGTTTSSHEKCSSSNTPTTAESKPKMCNSLSKSARLDARPQTKKKQRPTTKAKTSKVLEVSPKVTTVPELPEKGKAVSTSQTSAKSGPSEDTEGKGLASKSSVESPKPSPRKSDEYVVLDAWTGQEDSNSPKKQLTTSGPNSKPETQLGKRESDSSSSNRGESTLGKELQLSGSTVENEDKSVVQKLLSISRSYSEERPRTPESSGSQRRQHTASDKLRESKYSRRRPRTPVDDLREGDRSKSARSRSPTSEDGSVTSNSSKDPCPPSSEIRAVNRPDSGKRTRTLHEGQEFGRLNSKRRSLKSLEAESQKLLDDRNLGNPASDRHRSDISHPKRIFHNQVDERSERQRSPGDRRAPERYYTAWDSCKQVCEVTHRSSEKGRTSPSRTSQPRSNWPQSSERSAYHSSRSQSPEETQIPVHDYDRHEGWQEHGERSYNQERQGRHSCHPDGFTNEDNIGDQRQRDTERRGNRSSMRQQRVQNHQYLNTQYNQSQSGLLGATPRAMQMSLEHVSEQIAELQRIHMRNLCLGQSVTGNWQSGAGQWGTF